MRPNKADRRRRIGRGTLGDIMRTLRSMVRRYAVASTSADTWDLLGYVDDAGNQELDVAELFSGVGYFSRPNASHRSEVVSLKVGGKSGHAVIVATRDQDGLRGLLEKTSVGDGEVVVYNDSAMVKLSNDGKISIGSHGGEFQSLATKADLDALAEAFAVHIHPLTTGTSSATLTPTPVAVGTQKLEAE